MKTPRCHMCQNCQFVDKWAAVYKNFLKKSPNEKAFIKDQLAKDDKYLPCFYNKPEQDWDDLLDYDSAQELAA